MAIRCEKIRKAFGGTHALAGIDMVFPPSGIAAVVGPNGAGKTTLLNIMTGFTRADSGKCFIGHNEVTGLRPFQVAQLGVARTFQEVRLIREISVVENVVCARSRQVGEHLLRGLFGFGVADEEYRNRREAERVLRFVGLEHVGNRTGQELSYGQQKLLTLACALATEARVLLLDEPVAGVDPTLRNETLIMLTRLKNDMRLIVFIEHDLDAVKTVADSVFVMDQGMILAQGVPSEVLRRDDVLKAFVGG